MNKKLLLSLACLLTLIQTPYSSAGKNTNPAKERKPPAPTRPATTPPEKPVPSNPVNSQA